eukprot:GHVP01042454.1.p1 GENE.GHVP01042454.1~~GHVP01042454.1.p1  ORF type:complete len:296 (-),score=29.77 GHVP01042454.1:206-1093(-)
MLTIISSTSATPLRQAIVSLGLNDEVVKPPYLLIKDKPSHVTPSATALRAAKKRSGTPLFSADYSDRKKNRDEEEASTSESKDLQTLGSTNNEVKPLELSKKKTKTLSTSSSKSIPGQCGPQELANSSCLTHYDHSYAAECQVPVSLLKDFASIKDLPGFETWKKMDSTKFKSIDRTLNARHWNCKNSLKFLKTDNGKFVPAYRSKSSQNQFFLISDKTGCRICLDYEKQEFFCFNSKYEPFGPENRKANLSRFEEFTNQFKDQLKETNHWQQRIYKDYLELLTEMIQKKLNLTR